MLAGFNLLLWTTHLTDKLLHQCELIKLAGYDGVEVPIFEGDPSHYAQMGRKLDDQGLRRTAVGIVQSEDANPISSIAKHREKGIDHLKWMVDCSAEMGVETLCGPFFQPLGVFSGAGPTSVEVAHLVDAHQKMAVYARGTGVKIAVEPLNRFECYAMNTMEQASSIVRAVNQSNYGCLFDTFHANIEEKNIEIAITRAGDAINHVHYSENDRGTPGNGHIDFEEATRALKRIGYDGWVVIEAFGHALPDIAAATKVWRPLFGTEAEVVNGGIETIRGHWS